MHKLDAERARRAALDPAAAKAEAETFSSLHDATVYDHPPLLPVDEVVFDPMHAMHTEANVLLDESVHQFLVIDAENPAIAAEQKVVMADVNAMWQQAHLPKFIQFGKDDKGAHSHALNGPAFKMVMRSDLLLRTFKRMMTLWQLVEDVADRADAASPAAPPIAAAVAKAKAAATAAKKPPKKQAKKKKKRRTSNRVASFSDDESDSDEEPEPARTAAQSAASASDTPPPPEGQVPAAAPTLTYAQRTALAWASFLDFYDYLHDGHEIPAKDLTPAMRGTRAEHAVKLAKLSQRATLALVGTHRRRTYAHDLVYGLHQLYRLVGKPWNASTEGNEHAHQDMKNFFKHMVAHAGNHSTADCLQVLKLTHVKTYLMQQTAHKYFSASKYNAMRLNTIMKGKKGKAVGQKMYKKDTKLADNVVSLREWAGVQGGSCEPCETA